MLPSVAKKNSGNVYNSLPNNQTENQNSLSWRLNVWAEGCFSSSTSSYASSVSYLSNFTENKQTENS